MTDKRQPNDVIRLNIGKKMLLVASKNIRKGEEISDNYCIHFSDMKARERREWLEVSSSSHRQHIISNDRFNSGKFSLQLLL